MDQGQLFGRSVGFPPMVGEDGRVEWSVGPVNIKESIEIILLTEPGERIMLPQFGGGLQKFLFEPNITASHRLIQHHIIQALTRWEPRIKLKTVTVEPDPTEPQAALIVIDYTLVTTGAQDSVNLTIQLGA